MANPLSFDYGYYSESQIPNVDLRWRFNALAEKQQGITALAKLLRANDIEVASQDEPDGLDRNIIGGLFCALIQLSTDAHIELIALGDKFAVGGAA